MPFGWSQRLRLPGNILGVWLSLAERLLWEQEVGGSNPLTPTKFSQENHMSQDERFGQLVASVAIFAIGALCEAYTGHGLGFALCALFFLW